MRFVRRASPAPKPASGALAELLVRVAPKPLLADRVAKPENIPNPAAWRFEIKLDGYRMLAYATGGDVRLFSRKGLDWTSEFPQIVAPLRELELEACVLDGEVCALDADGIPRFNLVQRRDERARWVFFAFDILFFKKKDMRKEPLETRQKALSELLTPRPSSTVIVSPSVEGDPRELFRLATAAGHEGLMAKRKGSPYTAGKSRNWLKVKYTVREDFAVVGYVPLERANVVGGLILAMWEGDHFRYAGRVGTGLSDEDRSTLARELDAHRARTPPADGIPSSVIREGAIWSTPLIVVEVAFRERTGDGELREPSFQSRREDKAPKECTWERVRSSPRKH